MFFDTIFYHCISLLDFGMNNRNKSDRERGLVSRLVPTDLHKFKFIKIIIDNLVM